MRRCTDPYTVAYLALQLARTIHAKASPRDPHFLAVSVMCGKVVAWVEHHYPTYITFTRESRRVVYDESDPRWSVVLRDREMDEGKRRAERQAERDAEMGAWLEKRGAKAGEGAVGRKGDDRPHVQEGTTWQLYLFLIGTMALVFALGGGAVVGGLWYFYGEEFQWRPAEEGQGAVAVISKLLGTYRAPESGDPLVVER
jgi:farnesyl-diphosphate farnesyltransferase